MMLRAFCSVLLCLILSLTSVTAAVAHMRAAGAMQIVLCGTPGVEEVITLDAFGDPITLAHHCPDCLTLTADAVPAAIGVVRPVGKVFAVSPDWSDRALRPLSVPHPLARGPPLGL
jgi:hypothetical protein